MITKPIHAIAELYSPTWKAWNADIHKTSWTNSSPTIGGSISISGWSRNVSITQFFDGYRQLTVAGYKKYINPLDNETLTISPSAANGKYFTQQLTNSASPIMPSNYSNYLASGIYISDNDWGRDEDAAEDVRQGGNRINYTNPGVFRVTNGVISGYGSITIYYQNDSSGGKPVYPYTNASWKVGAYTAP